ncbi:MAG: MASE1 domain-containing protein [Pseudonocardia sp.]|nr:MASE1 domain-containing protein [Pseudonocardia sp.]
MEVRGGSRRGAIEGVAAALRGRPWLRLIAGNVVVAVGYWFLAEVGGLAQYRDGIEVAWLPVGFAAAMLYLGDLRWFIGVIVGDMIVGPNFIPVVDPTVPNLVATTGNTIEVVLAAYLMRRWLGRGNPLERPADVGRLFVAIAIGTAVSAVIGTIDYMLWLGLSWHDAPTNARTWWLGDTSGGLLLAPLLLVWLGRPWPTGWRRRELLEAVAIVGVVAGLSVAVFSSHHPLTYVEFPALVVAAVYLGQRGATVALVLTLVAAVLMTAANVGPFVEKSINDQALSTQLFILVSTLTTLILGAAVSARRRAAVELAESRQREAERAAEERQRIARDLHDSVSQTLFTLGLHTEIAKHEVARIAGAPVGPLADAIGEVAELARGALLELRASIFDLRGGAVAEQGLVAALAAHGAGLAVRHDVRVGVEGPSERLPLDPGHEELLFRIGQEAMTNAVKHSGSAAVSVRVAVEPGAVALTVRDDGAGFDPDRSYSGHLGLELMRSRAAEAGGRLTIESAPGAGTAVRVRFPAAATPPVDSPAPRAQPAAPPVSVS